ncbi:hypothetical protein C1645_825642 [Glomus cerebriforme]|uniref:Uncharacterized protein n=1 Tax=Glomus cerebriforme TaxID=658196 RepID=A0A397T133_9GLOM|nr:hypothetical protein C1645_825642 [Glomus cerebriforme]
MQKKEQGNYYQALKSHAPHKDNSQENRNCWLVAFVSSIITASDGLWRWFIFTSQKRTNKKYSFTSWQLLKNESEDESFLQKITQPSSCPSTPPRAVTLAKASNTPKKNK